MSARVGFMQGRLSDCIAGRIQAFPWPSWQEEFAVAERHGFALMEWTLDQERLHENPLMTRSGRDEIGRLMRRHGVGIQSLTGDCFMQAPFWKVHGESRRQREADFLAVAESCGALGISLIVVPLVDGGYVATDAEEAVLLEFLHAVQPRLRDWGVGVVFESDLPPADLARFIGQFDRGGFGVNYDIGNSASLGFDPVAEIAAYGSRILNVHVKDRLRGGTTVPLGTGAAQFKTVFAALEGAQYRGDFILQTARAADSDHAGVLCRYRDMTLDWLRRS